MHTAERRIAVSPAVVVRVLSDARSLAAWNPALGPIRPADARVVVGRPYRTVIRGFLPAVVTFTRVDETAVEYRLEGAGAQETGRWLIDRTADGASVVTHAFEHAGALLVVFRRAFVLVADWRLERLDHEARALVA
ncbi:MULTISPECIES: SRPBCC domain-containing protein [unclassified Curtobacterium]|uniref:SRPBCC family protein n=1 Tax=unclassified Curtobacterium TaxID=257496 RepID=UPI0011B73C04|nr:MULTISPECIES: SRPBCC family protein [unclassified Curtobacterium]